MSGSTAKEPHPDPGGAVAAINRHRDIAKYLVGVFAAIGGLLLAGTQLSSLGQLSFSEDPVRLLVAIGALVVGFAMVIAIIALAVSVLNPVEMSLDKVNRHEYLRKKVEERPSLLAGANSVRAFAELAESRFVEDEPDNDVEAMISQVVEWASFLESRRRFRRAWRGMIAAALLAAAAISVFAYASSPPEDEEAPGPVVAPAPQEVSVALTSDGREALVEPLGPRCVEGPVAALTIGGTESEPVLVTLPSGECEVVRFVLSSDLGVATLASGSG